MARARFSETQIFSVLKETETGIAVNKLNRKHDIGKCVFYKWKAKFIR